VGISYLENTAVVRTGAERATLVRRTYALVLANIVLTMLGVGIGFAVPSLMRQVAAHPILSMLATFIPLILAQRVRTRFPMNLIWVSVFTASMGVVISPLMWFYGNRHPGLITQAAGLTLGAFGVLTLYAWVSRRDFSAWGSFFVVGLWVLIGTSLLNLFFRSPLAELWIAGASVLVFSGLLVFDTWRLRNQYGPDDYVQAAVQIYLDLLNMFLAILRLLGGRRD
jgi:FtsH-binding integral membrane protein